MVHKMKARTITRTITTNSITALVFDKENKNVVTTYHTIIGNYSDSEIEKLLKDSLEFGERWQFVGVTQNDKTTNLYAMLEEEFVKNATIIDK